MKDILNHSTDERCDNKKTNSNMNKSVYYIKTNDSSNFMNLFS